METAFYLEKIRAGFSMRQRTNPTYSLRAYGRDLGIHPSTLSQVLLGRRPLPLKLSTQVADHLRLNARERTLFFDSLGKRRVSLDQIQISAEDTRFLLDETYFQIIAEWEHYAALTLFECEDFDPSPAEIARRLKIQVNRAEVVLINLIRFGLLKRLPSGELRPSHPSVRTTEDVASAALKASHRETLEMGKEKLDKVPPDLRDFSSMMVAIDPARLPEVKIVIREFRQKLSELLKSGAHTEVYQLGIQFYPLTDLDTNSEVELK